MPEGFVLDHLKVPNKGVGFTRGWGLIFGARGFEPKHSGHTAAGCLHLLPVHDEVLLRENMVMPPKK
jgi:hypothetical protein